MTEQKQDTTGAQTVVIDIKDGLIVVSANCSPTPELLQQVEDVIHAMWCASCGGKVGTVQ